VCGTCCRCFIESAKADLYFENCKTAVGRRKSKNYLEDQDVEQDNVVHKVVLAYPSLPFGLDLSLKKLFNYRVYEMVGMGGFLP
jgi:hypothetical protein